MQGNFNRRSDNYASSETPHNSEFEGFYHFQTAPITAQPQQFSRAQNGLVNCQKAVNRNNVKSARPFFNFAVTCGQNIRPWLKMSHHPDQSSRSNLSESVVINFENVSEPSTSNSMHSYEPYSYKAFPEPFEENARSVECTGSSEHQNSSVAAGEINIDAVHPDSTNSSQNHSISIYDNGSIIQNNEGTHTNNPNLSPSSGNQSLEKILNKYIPLITFLSLKAVYDHRQGILIFLGLLITFIHANSIVKREIAKQSHRSLTSLGIIFVNLLVSTFFIYFVFQDQQLYKNLTFIPPYCQPLSIWDVLWIVGITDFVLKFITIQLKVGIVCFPAKLLPYSARGKWFLMVERTSQLYRGLVPIQPWLYYLMEVYQGPQSMVGIFFLVVYLLTKGSDIISKAKLFLKAFLKLLHNTALGVRPSNEQLHSAGSQCPICHDQYNSPIMLQCRHVFCESCVSTWFDREQTCPLCRAKIADDPSWRDGATSLFTQLF